MKKTIYDEIEPIPNAYPRELWTHGEKIRFTKFKKTIMAISGLNPELLGKDNDKEKPTT